MRNEGVKVRIMSHKGSKYGQWKKREKRENENSGEKINIIIVLHQ